MYYGHHIQVSMSGLDFSTSGQKQVSDMLPRSGLPCNVNKCFHRPLEMESDERQYMLVFTLRHNVQRNKGQSED